MSSKIFYVYELWNPLTDQIFYVGKGTRTTKGYRRLAEHIKDTRYYKSGKFKQTHKYNTISKIMDSNKLPEIKIVFESLNEVDAFTEERRRISFYGRRDIGTGILVNHTDGGEGMAGYRHTPEHLARLKRNNPGGKATAKQIVAICPQSNTVKHTFPSSQSAAEMLTGSPGNKANINQACRKHKRRISYGYYWRYSTEYDITEDVTKYNILRTDLSKRNSKQIAQYDLSGRLIHVWASASDVCRQFGVGVTTLHKYLKHNKEWKGFYWKYN
ncbi:hypothetical protein Xoosp13_169 [Xanthomonas phage Xoo-sp13]|nr:hypothetical protein Xoosp13_169 [Xanthomonas phage Xoo-sp13]